MGPSRRSSLPHCATHATPIENYIGYAHGRLRQLGLAMQHYQQALLLNRRHRSATEHLVKLYPVLGEPTKGEEQLARLVDICLIPSTETADLKRAIAVSTLALRLSQASPTPPTQRSPPPRGSMSAALDACCGSSWSWTEARHLSDGDPTSRFATGTYLDTPKERRDN